MRDQSDDNYVAATPTREPSTGQVAKRTWAGKVGKVADPKEPVAKKGKTTDLEEPATKKVAARRVALTMARRRCPVVH